MSNTMTATGRGLYGQNEGNESRQTGEWVEDRIHENWLIEGEWQKPMTAAAERGDLKEVARLRDKMKEVYIEGGVHRDLAQQRADVVMTLAMNHYREPGAKPRRRRG